MRWDAGGGTVGGHVREGRYATGQLVGSPAGAAAATEGFAAFFNLCSKV